MEVSERADTLKRYAKPLGDILDGFETESEYEFVYWVPSTNRRTTTPATDRRTVVRHYFSSLGFTFRGVLVWC